MSEAIFKYVLNGPSPIDINESFSIYFQKINYIEENNEKQKYKEISFLNKKTSRNELICPKENNVKSKPKIQKYKKIFLVNKKGKSKAENDSNINFIKQKNAYKYNDKINFNAKKKEKENLLDKIGAQIFELFFIDKNGFEGEKETVNQKPEEYIKNLMNFLEEKKLRELLEGIDNISFAKINENKEENEEVILLLEKNSLEYIKNTLSKPSS